jgi:hypothetical protein
MIYTKLRNFSITAALLISLEAQAALSEGQKESYEQAKKDFNTKEYSKTTKKTTYLVNTAPLEHA